MSLVREEDHLILLIESFTDFRDGSLLLGYDLRIDSYTHISLSPPLKKNKFKPGQIYQIRKKITASKETPISLDLKSESLVNVYFDDDDYHIEQKLKIVSESDLNPIEKIYFTNFTQNRWKLEPQVALNPAKFLIGIVDSIKPEESVLGSCFDLSVITSEFQTPLLVRIQTNSFETKSPIGLLVREIQSSTEKTIRVLGYKNNTDSAAFLEKDALFKINSHIRRIDFR